MTTTSHPSFPPPAELDPAVAAALDDLVARGRRPFHTLTAATAREQQARLARIPGPVPEGLAIDDETLDLAGRGLRVRHYRVPDSPGVIVYVHGGGWTVGDLDGFDTIARGLALGAGVDVLSVDYRLAPEHRFPAGLDDVEAALTWSLAHDPRPHAIAGDSAGGNLAAAVVARLGDGHRDRLRAAVLLYPVVDAAARSAAYDEVDDDRLVVTGRDMDWFIDLYLPDETTRHDPAASPLRGDLHDFPPTFLVVAGHDPLRDEDRAFAAALTDAGVPVEVDEHPAMAHGFAGWTAFLPEAVDTLTRASRFAAREFTRG